MILDPRLVPWNAVATGVGVALPFAITGYYLWKWRIAALALLTVAPVVGWAAAIWLLQGRPPQFSPSDAPHYALHFAIAGAFVSVFGFWKKGCTGCMGPLARLIFFPALWILIFKPVFKFELGTMGWKILAFALIGMGIIGLWHKRAARWPAAEYAPWLLALTAASICLSLSGTASVGMMALTLCFAALPAAIAMLADSLRKHHIPMETDEPATDGGKPVAWLTPDSQAVTLPLAFAFPVLVCCGPLYASTTWGDASLLLATPVAGFTALRFFTNRRQKRDSYIPTSKSHFAAIAVALIAAAIPSGIAVFRVMAKAAAEEPYY